MVSFKRIYSQFKHLKLSSFGVWENFYINTQYFLYTRLSHLSDLYNISPAFTKLSDGKISILLIIEFPHFERVDG